MELDVRYGGLKVNGAIAQHPYDDFAALLQQAAAQIDSAIESLKSKNPTGNPSIWVLYLGAREAVLSPAGLTTPQQGLYPEADMLQQPYHGYWDAALEAGFTPEAREASGFLEAPAGVYLLVKWPA